MEVTRRRRRLITVPVWCLAVGLHLWLWCMWLSHAITYRTFWRWEKLAAAVTVTAVVTEAAMSGPDRGQKRGFDVLPKE